MTMATTVLNSRQRIVIVVVAFLGWLWAGMHMSTTQLTGQAAALDLLARTDQIDLTQYQTLAKQLQKKSAEISEPNRIRFEYDRSLVLRWFSWFQCSFLFGAAAGGFLLGKLGDRWGRSKAMSISILIYAGFAGATALAQAPWQLCLLWFLACTGVGGMWPNGVALISEVWTGMSRPAIAGVIGTAANVGLFLMATLGANVAITPDSWRWMMWIGTIPVVLGLASLVLVPESPRWLASRHEANVSSAANATASNVFRPPLLSITLVAILLGTIPMIGGWGTANWMIPWAGEAGEASHPPDPFLKARVGQVRALTGIVGSLLGGWVAAWLGRRSTYFWTSVLSLGLAQYIFWFLVPTDGVFLIWVGALGFVSGIYFGWLPLCLPELFPTRVRSTGAGLGFNFGRIVTAVTIFLTGALTQFFAGDYTRIGKITSLLFVLGMVGIWFAPDTSKRSLED